ncbi:SDR family NAD(P)-dependent oxidoreductase [Halococcus agarilyticus]|uniref:SDR family NAD(P)-dependent oxidoreductase n=1 Tax=Halococcus agarilyticus TaxID=1232219 RepID=UPI000677E277|nr:glucose 1-dehydrogenase [Halococcus agarilyticus]
MRNLVDGKATVVTGGAQGIGEATALRFAEEGADVVVADVDEEGGHGTVDAIEDAGGSAVFVETDVSEAAEVQTMITRCVEEFGGIDVLFNNAGIDGPLENIVEYDEDGFDRVIDVNLKGVWLGLKYGIEAMLADGGGSIISTSSIGGQVAVPEYSGYGASKAGVSLITKSAALEFATEGIRANAIAPGLVETPMVNDIMEENPEMEEQFRNMEPMGGLAQPKEIANSVLFLGSDLASRVTGHTLAVEGGYLSQ